MAGKPDHNNDGPDRAGLGPPALAHSLLAMAADPADKAALIGDLHEEFLSLARRSPGEARAWYWRQTAGSAPHLVMKRLRSEQAKRLAIMAAAIIGAFALMGFWDQWIARNAARRFAAMTQAQTYFLPRTVYLLVQMAGIAVAGGMIAALTFRKSESFFANVLRRLVPAAIILTAPTLITMLSGADNYDLSFRLVWLALSLPALYLGARVAVWLHSK